MPVAAEQLRRDGRGIATPSKPRNRKLSRPQDLGAAARHSREMAAKEMQNGKDTKNRLRRSFDCPIFHGVGMDAEQSARPCSAP